MSELNFQQIADNLSNKLIADPTAYSPYGAGADFVAGVEEWTDAASRTQREASKGFLDQLGIVEGLEAYGEPTAAQLQAASHILTAAGGKQLMAHAQNSMSFEPSAGNVDMIIGPVNSEAYVAGTEDFSEEKLGETVGHSMMFNFASAKQSPIAEGLYPTYVVPANKTGFRMFIRRTVVFKDVAYNDDGRPVDFKKESLLYAETRPEILENEYTNVYPTVTPESESRFVPTSVEANEVISFGEATINTRSLRMDQKVNIMGISRYPGMIGEFDHTDVLDPNIRTKNVTISVTTNNGTADELDVFKINTVNHQYAMFEAVQEGNTRKMRNSYSTEFTLNANTKNASKAAAALVANLGLSGSELQVVLKLRTYTEIDLNTSNMEISAGEIRVERILRGEDELGAGDTDYDAIMAALAGKLKVEGIGYKLFRTNQNERERGVLIGSDSFTLQFLIAPGSPFTNVRPKGATDGDADLNDLIVAVRAKANADALKAMMAHREECEALHNNEQAISSTRLPGIHYLEKPYFYSKVVDLSTITNITEHEKSADIKALLVDEIRKALYLVEAETGYTHGLEVLGIQSQPEVLMATTTQVQQHLMVEGDARTASIAYKHRTVTSRSGVMRGTVDVNGDQKPFHRLVMAFMPKTEQPCPLQFGSHMWMSEQVTKATLTRKGATNSELTVTPRNHHFNLCPIYMELLVVGL